MPAGSKLPALTWHLDNHAVALPLQNACNRALEHKTSTLMHMRSNRSCTKNCRMPAGPLATAASLSPCSLSHTVAQYHAHCCCGNALAYSAAVLPQHATGTIQALIRIYTCPRSGVTPIQVKVKNQQVADTPAQINHPSQRVTYRSLANWHHTINHLTSCSAICTLPPADKY